MAEAAVGMFLHREPGLHPEKRIGSGQVARAGNRKGNIGRVPVSGVKSAQVSSMECVWA